jgi:hypothetical protein
VRGQGISRMEIQQVLDQHFDKINSSIKSVHLPKKYADSVTAFGLVQKKVDLNYTLDSSFCKLFKHRLFLTRQYRDKGCAAYKLIRFLENVLSDDVEEIFWRVKPNIGEINDFDSQYRRFQGRVRFSTFP